MQKPFQIMFLGTGSDVGKSIITAGFCRILKRMGYSVAPFKAQNMALNSFVTMDGGEMGRAQVFQAQAAGVLPHWDMNPVLLKPSGNNLSQIIVQGKVWENMKAENYYSIKQKILPRILESYGHIAKNYNAVILEGAGSAAEVNLREKDLVNFHMAIQAGAPVVLVADIDRGGVFASIIGTMNLLCRKEKKLVIGFIINKFRGEKSLFKDGIKFIEKTTKRPVFGVVPYIKNLKLPEEDSVSLQRGLKGSYKKGARVKIAVIHLPFISNYTDFDPLELEDDVSLIYATKPLQLKGASVVIIPGTKNTIHDLSWLYNKGFLNELKEHRFREKTIIGICGGYQMLGIGVHDPYGIETTSGSEEGLGFLPIETLLDRNKILKRVKGVCMLPGIEINGKPVYIEGYEIHMGISRILSNARPAFKIIDCNQDEKKHFDGLVTDDGKVWGTYLHGLFENDLFRRLFLMKHGSRKKSNLNYFNYINLQYDRLADILEEHINIPLLLKKAESFR